MDSLVVEFQRPAYVNWLLAPLFTRYDSVTVQGDNMGDAHEELRNSLLTHDGVVLVDKPRRLIVHCSGLISYLRVVKSVKQYVQKHSTPTTITITHYV